MSLHDIHRGGEGAKRGRNWGQKSTFALLPLANHCERSKNVFCLVPKAHANSSLLSYCIHLNHHEFPPSSTVKSFSITYD